MDFRVRYGKCDMASHANASTNVNRKTAECSEDFEIRGRIYFLGCDIGCVIWTLGCDMGYAIWHHMLIPQLM